VQTSLGLSPRHVRSVTTITSVRRLTLSSDVTDETLKGSEKNRGGVTLPKRVVRTRFVARLCLVVGVLAVIPAFLLPGTYPLNPRLEPRVWYVVGGDWLGIGITLLALGILFGVLSRHIDSRRPS
jgi:hypothetical protein